ncbi:hypothetical protein ACFQ0I_09260 [Mariniflexile aquimaris]|uniref:Uncharacterized protein n=1 Tax=Mariniflexile aquimaris TaxID=881009 RepID=A0ABW3BSD0_9FLAO
MKNSTGTPIGISVNKSSAEQKYQVRDTVFRKGSELNMRVSFYEPQRNVVGYTSQRRDNNDNK